MDQVPNKTYWLARREHAWVLRKRGLTYREIALRLGVNPTRARRMVEQVEGE